MMRVWETSPFVFVKHAPTRALVKPRHQPPFGRAVRRIAGPRTRRGFASGPGARHGQRRAATAGLEYLLVAGQAGVFCAAVVADSVVMTGGDSGAGSGPERRWDGALSFVGAQRPFSCRSNAQACAQVDRDP